MTVATKINEQEAVETIARAATPFLKRITTDASRAEICRLLIDAIHTETLGLADAVAGAIGGEKAADPYLDRAVRHVAREHLASRFIPEELGPFLDHVLRSSGPANFPRGHHAYNDRYRNIVIKVLVQETKRRWGVDIERSDATSRDKPCACSLVADAMKTVGIGIQERRVVEIVRGT